jgi:hypothetical protein
MLKRICAILESNPGAKAKMIASQMGVDRADVNRFLYEHKDKFEKDSDHQWYLVSDVCRIEFGGDGWLTSWHFEKALAGLSPLKSHHRAVVFVLKDDCKPLLEFLGRFLALCNQLVESGKAVTLDIEHSKATLSYLDRVGFFGLLAPTIAVRPQRPSGDLAKTFNGNNDGVIEFRSIDPAAPNQEIPRLLQKSFVACAGDSYSATAFTVLAELFGNVHEHSGTDSAGFACLQFYRKSRKIQAVISDNGLGIVGTLAPVLGKRYPETSARVAAAPHAGVALLEEIFSHGKLSQVKADGRGLGLRVSSELAGKFRAKITVRQSDFEFRIHHGPGGVQFTHRLNLAQLNGTHICFEFKLDAVQNSP